MLKCNNKFFNFLFCILFLFSSVTWANTKYKLKHKILLPDTIVREFSNSILIFEADEYSKLKQEIEVFIEPKNPMDWHYIYNIKKIIEQELQENNLPIQLVAGIFFELHHFRQNEMYVNLPALGESNRKLYPKDDIQKKAKIEITDLEEHLGNVDKYVCAVKNPFLVLKIFIKTLKTLKTAYKSDFLLLNHFFYNAKEISENCKKDINDFGNFCVKNEIENKNLTFKFSTLCPQEPFKAFVIWEIITEKFRSFEPNYILEKYTCQKGDTWQSIIKEKEINDTILYKYNNFFVDLKGKPIPIDKIKNIILEKNTILVIPVPNISTKPTFNKYLNLPFAPQNPILLGNKISEFSQDSQANIKNHIEKLNEQKRKKEQEINKAEKEIIGQTMPQEKRNDEEQKMGNPTKMKKYSSSKYLDVGLMKSQQLKANETKNTQYHIVKQGETLWKLHQKYKVSVENMKQWNNIGGDYKIFPGQKLIITKEKLRGKKLSTTFENFRNVRNILPKILQKNNKKIAKLAVLKNKITQNTSNKYIKNYKFYVSKTKNATPKSTKRTTKK